MIEQDREVEISESSEPVVEVKEDFDPEAVNPEETVDSGSPFYVKNDDWSIEGVGRINKEGEQVYDMHQSGVCYIEIEDAEYLDPQFANRLIARYRK